MQKILIGRLSPVRGRINYLDALKCLGIFGVLVHHVRDIVFGVKVYDTIPGLMIYSFNMPLFFFCSGLLAYKSNMGIGNAIQKVRQKFLFLVIPAVIFRFFSYILSHHNPIDVIFTGFGKYWFTITLFECFLLYYLSHVFFKKEKVRHLFLLIVAYAGLVVLSIHPKSGLALLDLNHLTKYFHFFVLGILAMKYKTHYEKIMKSELVKAIVSVSFFLLLFLLDYSIWPMPVFHFLRDIVLRYLGTLMVVSFFVCHAEWFEDNTTKINKIVLGIGKMSLAIYLVHYFFIPHSEVFNKWGVSLDNFTLYVFVIFYSLAILAFCVIFISVLSNSMFIRKYVLGRK